jgi:hypothetical protein
MHDGWAPAKYCFGAPADHDPQNATQRPTIRDLGRQPLVLVRIDHQRHLTHAQSRLSVMFLGDQVSWLFGGRIAISSRVCLVPAAVHCGLLKPSVLCGPKHSKERLWLLTSVTREQI